MGFTVKLRKWAAVVLLCAATAGAVDNAHIKVLVSNSAGVGDSVLIHAEMAAARVFEGAGVDIDWSNCGSAFEPDACGQVLGPDEYMVHLVPNGITRTNSVFGEAFLGEDGTGKYCDVFFNRIESSEREFGTTAVALLGNVMAHELGHLLLGSHAHSMTGIMQPTWDSESMRNIGMGSLFFTSQQSKLMRARVAKQMLVVSSRTIRFASQRPATGAAGTVLIRQGFLP